MTLIAFYFCRELNFPLYLQANKDLVSIIECAVAQLQITLRAQFMPRIVISCVFLFVFRRDIFVLA